MTKGFTLSIAGEIWERTFGEDYEEYVVDIQHEPFENLFGDILNGGVNDIADTDSVPYGIEIKKYTSNLNLAQALRKPIEQGAQIFAPDPKTCEKALKEFYPELFKRKNLLSFPVGQYVYYLHLMWNIVDNRLELSFENVYKCFSTGWLEIM